MSDNGNYDRDARHYDNWIYTAVRHALYWMRKAGFTKQARRAFWMALAEAEE